LVVELFSKEIMNNPARLDFTEYLEERGSRTVPDAFTYVHSRLISYQLFPYTQKCLFGMVSHSFGVLLVLLSSE
jgi:hypothetical protein